MTRRAATYVCAVAVAVLLAAGASGDGGLLRVNRTVGAFQIAVFTAPTPPRVGTVDVSVLVQTAAEQTPVLDAEVEIVLRGRATERSAEATHAAATNKLLYAALIEVPAAGRWELTAHVRTRADEATVTIEIEVAPRLGAAWTYWPHLALPAVVVVIFAIHQYLKAFRHGGRRGAQRRA